MKILKKVDVIDLKFVLKTLEDCSDDIYSSWHRFADEDEEEPNLLQNVKKSISIIKENIK